MKKIILGIAAVAMLSSSLMAAPAERHAGINAVDLGNDTDYGINFGMDKLWNPVTSAPGFGVGAGFDIDFNTFGFEGAESNFIYGGDVKALIGYNFAANGLPVQVKAGIGYDFTVVTGDSYMSGMIYTASVGYDFSKAYGVEAVYRGGTLDYETAVGTGPEFDKNVYSLNFVWRH